jgi:DNA repair protein RecO (recombination protein O)
MLVNDQAVCIRCTDFSETSQIVTFFTREHGKIGAIAKGAKRAKSSFGGAIEVYSYGTLLYREAPQGGLSTLCEFEPRHDIVAGLSRQIHAYYCSLLAGELLNKLTQEHDAHPELFDRLLDFLRRISGADLPMTRGNPVVSRQEALGFLFIFLPELLAEIGLRLHIDSCGNCQTQSGNENAEIYFSSQVSSLICRNCEASFPDRLILSPEVLACLRSPPHIMEAREETVQDAVRLLLGHFTNILHQRPKTAKFVLG